MIWLVTTEPIITLSGAMKVCSASWPSGAIIVSMAMTGVPESITFLIGSLSVPMPKVCSATKSHFWVARLSTAERCLVADSSPSNQVISTFISLPQASAACLPCAHQVACRPALPMAAFSGLPDGFSSCAIAGSKPAAPSRAPASAVAPIALNMSRRLLDSSIRSSSTCTSSLAGSHWATRLLFPPKRNESGLRQRILRADGRWSEITKASTAISPSGSTSLVEGEGRRRCLGRLLASQRVVGLPSWQMVTAR